jgi:hypothetical protein
MENVKFEHTIDWNEAKYKDIWSNYKPNYLKTCIVIIAGIICLFSKYTLIVGCLIIVGSFLGLCSLKIFSVGHRRNYKGHIYLHESLRYGVNDSSLWVKGKKIDAKCDWKNLVTWQINGDWLILTPSGIPQIILPIDEMKKNKAYENIFELAKKFGKKFR